jgi:hypothetical protein
MKGGEMRYIYSVVRYVPHPASGEFVNVGVIAGSDETGDWSLRESGNKRRARLFGPLASLTAVDAFMNEVGSRIDRFSLMQGGEVSEAWLEDLHRRHRNVVQLSSPTPIIAESAEEALDSIFGEVVVEGDAAEGGTVRGYATRLRLFSELKSSYRQQQIPPRLIREKALVSVGGLKTPMDFVIGNGAAVQLAHTWSFQLQSIGEVVRDVKSWAFTVERLLERGGRTLDEPAADVPSSVDVQVVLAPPRTNEQEKAYAEAQKVFSALNVDTVAEDDVRKVAQLARRRLDQQGFAPDLDRLL